MFVKHQSKKRHTKHTGRGEGNTVIDLNVIRMIVHANYGVPMYYIMDSKVMVDINLTTDKQTDRQTD